METQEQKDFLSKMLVEITDLKLQLLLQNNPFTGEWIPRNLLMNFMQYADTQMSALEKTENLVVSKVGKRKFYHRDSILRMLKDSIIK
jgi:hypothetical protein